MYTLSQFDAFLFALDGVILDSVELMVSAYGELYDAHGDEIRGMVESYQRANPAELRPERIAMLHRSLLGTEPTAPELAEECRRLGRIILDEIPDCPLMPDIAETLRVLRDRCATAHIVAGTPQAELEAIVAAKGLAPLFRSIHGVPPSRDIICEAVIAANRLDRTRCLFIGHTMADYRCAAHLGIHFLGIGEFLTAPFPFGTEVTERLGDTFLEIATARLGRHAVAPSPVGFGRRSRAA